MMEGKKIRIFIAQIKISNKNFVLILGLLIFGFFESKVGIYEFLGKAGIFFYEGLVFVSLFGFLMSMLEREEEGVRGEAKEDEDLTSKIKEQSFVILLLFIDKFS